jgi:hypothetical protein
MYINLNFLKNFELINLCSCAQIIGWQRLNQKHQLAKLIQLRKVIFGSQKIIPMYKIIVRIQLISFLLVGDQIFLEKIICLEYFFQETREEKP